MTKSTVEQIRERFDNDVERFSNLETGQTATMDAPLILERIAEAARRTNPNATHVLDIGCGAGNYTLKLLGCLPNLNAMLVDLSRPMLDRAQERISAQTTGKVITRQADIRDVELGEEQFDVILAAMVLHHLRDRAEWEAVFTKLYRALKSGGSLWIADHIEHELGPIQEMMQNHWGEYLSQFKGDDYRDHVFAYVAQEDTPRPLLFQTDLMRQVGFVHIDVLHMNTLFAAFGGIK
jgi:tRNA (cmo5U34)-methyltransferase